MRHCSTLSLGLMVGALAACSQPPLEEGRYELSTSLVANSCPGPEVSLDSGLVLDIIEASGDYWGGVELNFDATLEGWFEGGGALGQGESYLYVDGHAHAIWTIELYPEDGDLISGRANLDVAAETVTTWEDCFMSLDLTGARM